MRLEEDIKEYLQFCEEQKRLDKKTIKAYRIDLFQYATCVFDKEKAFEKAVFEGYLRGLHSKYGEKTVKRKIASIKAFAKYLIHYKEYEIVSFVNINTKFRESKKLPKVIELYNIRSLLANMYKRRRSLLSHNEINILMRDIAIIELLLGTGIRVSELCNLTLAEVDLISGVLKINGKGAKERILAISNKNLLYALKKYTNSVKNRYNESFFFQNRLGNKLSEQSVRFIIKKYTNLAGITQKITPHMFRHSFATLLLEQDVDIRYIQRMLGHSSISTTEIYTFVSSSKQREILLNKNPRNLLGNIS